MTRKSVMGGYCAYPDTVECALSRLDCDDPANFMSAREMEGGPVNAHGGACRWQSSVGKHLLGRCVDESGLPTECASNADACPAWDDSHELEGWTPGTSPFASPRGWAGPAPECPVSETTFGRCDYGMCAWSHEHCTEDNTWEPFSEGCTCDQVQVGACYRVKKDGDGNDQKEAYCAVSKDACDAEQNWIVPQEVNTAVGYDCFLCREVSPPEDAKSADPALTSDLYREIGGGGGNMNTAVIAIVCVGAVLGLSIIGLVGWKALRTRREIRERAKRKEESRPPATTIRISDDGCENGGGMNHSTDMDNASVLSDDTR